MCRKTNRKLQRCLPCDTVIILKFRTFNFILFFFFFWLSFFIVFFFYFIIIIIFFFFFFFFAFCAVVSYKNSGMANSVDPDQTAPSGAVCSGSTLFAYAILSGTLVHEILGHRKCVPINLNGSF